MCESPIELAWSVLNVILAWAMLHCGDQFTLVEVEAGAADIEASQCVMSTHRYHYRPSASATMS